MNCPNSGQDMYYHLIRGFVVVRLLCVFFFLKVKGGEGKRREAKGGEGGEGRRREVLHLPNGHKHGEGRRREAKGRNLN